MRLTVIAFGKLKTPGLRQAADHYVKGLRHWSQVEELELRAAAAVEKSPEARRLVQEKEAAQLRDHLQRRGRERLRLCILDETGRTMTSRAWAQMLSCWQDAGAQEAVFCVGSALGFDEQVRQMADEVLSFGPQTLPHELCRVVLLEQLFRAQSILHNHPYHNEG